MSIRIALLRGINVGGKKRVPMAELRKVASGIGLERVATYIASGNLLFVSDDDPTELESRLEEAIAGHFGFEVVVVVRMRRRWLEYAAGSAFPDAERDRDRFLHLGVSKLPPADGAADVLARYTSNGERVELLPDGLWIDYRRGAGRSRLTPAVLDRAVGSTVTARNWRTVQKLGDMVRGGW